MRLRPPLHARDHFGLGTDPHEMVLVPASIMGTVIGSASLSNGLTLYKGTLYLPDRDGPSLLAGEEIVISYAHFEPPGHFSWMGARAHVVTGLDDVQYDYRHPWESDPWNGGVGGPADGTSRTWNKFTCFAAVTNDDGEVATWTFPSSGAHAEQYAFDDTAVGHIGYLMHDFSVANETGVVSVAYSGASTERTGSFVFSTGTPVIVGDMVGESQVSATSSEIGITLTEDVPAGSQLIIVSAAKGPAGFNPTDAGSRPQILVRLPSGSFVPKYRRDGQHHTLPEFSAAGTSVTSAAILAGAGLVESGGVLAVNVDGTSVVIVSDVVKVGTIDGGSP